jgi:hypothetical protein
VVVRSCLTCDIGRDFHSLAITSTFSFLPLSISTTLHLCHASHPRGQREQLQPTHNTLTLRDCREGVRSPSAHLGLCSFDVASRACSLARAAPTIHFSHLYQKSGEEKTKFDFLTS